MKEREMKRGLLVSIICNMCPTTTVAKDSPDGTCANSKHPFKSSNALPFLFPQTKERIHDDKVHQSNGKEKDVTKPNGMFPKRFVEHVRGCIRLGNITNNADSSVDDDSMPQIERHCPLGTTPEKVTDCKGIAQFWGCGTSNLRTKRIKANRKSCKLHAKHTNQNQRP